MRTTHIAICAFVAGSLLQGCTALSDNGIVVSKHHEPSQEYTKKVCDYYDHSTNMCLTFKDVEAVSDEHWSITFKAESNYQLGDEPMMTHDYSMRVSEQAYNKIEVGDNVRFISRYTVEINGEKIDLSDSTGEENIQTEETTSVTVSP